MAPLPTGTYCKIPQDYQANVVRGARNYPVRRRPRQAGGDAAGVPQQQPYVPLGTNPWYGDPNQILNCPAPGRALRPAGRTPAW